LPAQRSCKRERKKKKKKKKQVKKKKRKKEPQCGAKSSKKDCIWKKEKGRKK
jgi:hypothetical protein